MIAQFKLTSGEEVVCQVVEWPKDGGDYIVRNAMCLSINMDDNLQIVYGLRPWMSMIESSSEFILLNPDSVVAMTQPNMKFVYEYEGAMSDIKKTRSVERVIDQLKAMQKDTTPSNVFSLDTYHFGLDSDQNIH